MKSSSNLWVNINEQVVLLCQLSVTALNPLPNPVTKRLLDKSEYQVYEPLPGNPLDLTLVRKILRRYWVLPSLLVDVYETQAIILRAK